MYFLPKKLSGESEQQRTQMSYSGFRLPPIPWAFPHMIRFTIYISQLISLITNQE